MSSVDLSPLYDFVAAMNVSLSEQQALSLSRFYDIVSEKGKSLNLTAIKDGFSFVSRHFADSLSAARIFPSGAEVCDVGAGAGFPSVPLAIVRPDVFFTALDSTEKKTDFIKYAAKQLGLENLSVETGRAEDFCALFGKFDFVCARAVTALSPLTELCFPLLKTGGCLVAYKTKSESVSDCANALAVLHGRIEDTVEYTLPDKSERVLYVIKKLSPTPKGYPRRWGQIKNKPL